METILLLAVGAIVALLLLTLSQGRVILALQEANNKQVLVNDAVIKACYVFAEELDSINSKLKEKENEVS